MSSVADRSVQNKVNQYFPALTGLRALTILLIYISHARLIYADKSSWLSQFLEEFDCALSIFFMLSGFLIAHRYRNPLARHEVHIRSYVVQRIARVLPVYLLVTLTYFIYTHQTDWKAWLLNLTLTRSLFKDYLYVGVGPAWSLTVEECFYFIAPALFVWFNRRYSIVLLTLLTLGIGACGVFISQKLGLGSFLQDIHFMLDYTFMGRCFSFYIGIKLADYFEVNQEVQSTPSWLRFRYKTALGFTWMLGSIVLSLVLKQQSGVLKQWAMLLVFLNEHYLLMPGICLILAGLITEKNWLQQVLASKPLNFMGKASYIFYLLHAGVFFEILYYHVSKSTLVLYLLFNVISIIGFVLYEEPARKFLVRKLAGRDRQNC